VQLIYVLSVQHYFCCICVVLGRHTRCRPDDGKFTSRAGPAAWPCGSCAISMDIVGPYLDAFYTGGADGRHRCAVLRTLFLLAAVELFPPVAVRCPAQRNVVWRMENVPQPRRSRKSSTAVCLVFVCCSAAARPPDVAASGSAALVLWPTRVPDTLAWSIPFPLCNVACHLRWSSCIRTAGAGWTEAGRHSTGRCTATASRRPDLFQTLRSGGICCDSVAANGDVGGTLLSGIELDSVCSLWTSSTSICHICCEKQVNVNVPNGGSLAFPMQGRCSLLMLKLLLYPNLSINCAVRFQIDNNYLQHAGAFSEVVRLKIENPKALMGNTAVVHPPNWLFGLGALPCEILGRAPTKIRFTIASTRCRFAVNF